jgi:hypothetical protein
MTNKVRIAGAIASNTGVTFYLDNGGELNLAKDHPTTIKVMDLVVEALKRNEQVTINLDDFSVEKKLEKQTRGAIRLVRGAFSKIKAMLGGSTEDADVEKLGQVRLASPASPAAPVSSPMPIEPEELHAIVDGKIIPGVEALSTHIEHAVETNDTEGLQRFMERIAAVIDTRSHSVKELLNFMRRGDLPIAKDGSIVAYKVLQSRATGFVDCHSKKVTQKLGSFVQMDEKLVDPNRRNECSTGLHIARRAYLSGFGGDIITLVKVAPEDVIAVPPGEPNKMRAKGYHICAVLPKDVHQTLRNNQPMTGNEKAAKLLADVIAGNHTPILEFVNIGSAMGGNVTVTPVEGAKKIARAAVGTSGTAKALDDKAPEEKVELSLKEVRKKVDDAYVEAKKVKKPKAVKTTKAKAPAKSAPVARQIPEKYQKALDLIAAGQSQREVAKLLNVCPKTMRKYLKG